MIGLVGWGIARSTEPLGPWWSLILSGSVAAVLFAVTLPIRPEWRVLKTRGLVGRRTPGPAQEVQL